MAQTKSERVYAEFLKSTRRKSNETINPPEIDDGEIEASEIDESNFGQANTDETQQIDRPIDLLLDEGKLACMNEIEKCCLAQMREKTNFIVLVAGMKNAGKSTFGRNLMNQLLEKGLSVYHLECDPGQTEFSPPGCLSLTEVIERVNSLPFKHLRTPVSCKFFGETTPSNRTGEYIECIRRLIVDFERISHEKSPSCLVVNTCGWILGAGLAALLDICRASKPHHIVLLCPRAKDRREDTLFAHKEIMSVVSAQTRCSLIPCRKKGGNKSGLTSAQWREAALLSYFGYKMSMQTMNLDALKSFLSLYIRTSTPFVVPMSDVSVNVVHGVAPPPYVLSILNASLVALCRHEDGHQDKHWLDDPRMPKVMQDSVADLQCLGFGVIRAIDMETRTFYLVTPVPKDVLARVNTFLKGNISLPSAVFIKQRPQRSEIDIPYVVRGSKSLELDDDQLTLHELDETGFVWKRSRRETKRMARLAEKKDRKRKRSMTKSSSEPKKKKKKMNKPKKPVEVIDLDEEKMSEEPGTSAGPATGNVDDGASGAVAEKRMESERGIPFFPKKRQSYTQFSQVETRRSKKPKQSQQAELGKTRSATKAAAASAPIPVSDQSPILVSDDDDDVLLVAYLRQKQS